MSRSSDSDDNEPLDVGIEEIDDEFEQLEKIRKSLHNNLRLRPIKSSGSLRPTKGLILQPDELATLLESNSKPLILDARNGTPTLSIRDSIPITFPSLILRRSKLPSNPITSLESLRAYVTTESGRTRLDSHNPLDPTIVIYDDGTTTDTAQALLNLAPTFARELFHSSFSIDPPPETLKFHVTSLDDDQDTGEGLYHLSTNQTYKPKHPFRVTQSASTAGVSSLPAMSGAHSRLNSALPSSLRSSARSAKPPALSLGPHDNFAHFLPPPSEVPSPQISAAGGASGRPNFPQRRPSAPVISSGSQSSLPAFESRQGDQPDITSSLPPPRRKLSSATSNERLPKLSLNTNTRPVVSLATAIKAPQAQAKSAIALSPPVQLGTIPSNGLSLNLAHSNFSSLKKKNSTPDLLSIPAGLGGPGKRPKSPGLLKLQHSNLAAAEATLSKSRDPSPMRQPRGSPPPPPLPAPAPAEPQTPESHHYSLSPVTPDQPQALLTNGHDSEEPETPYYTPPHTPRNLRGAPSAAPLTSFFSAFPNGDGDSYPNVPPPPLPEFRAEIMSPQSATSENGQVIYASYAHMYPGDRDRENGDIPPSPMTARPTAGIKSSFGQSGFPPTPNQIDNEPGGGSENAPPPFTISTILPGFLYLGPDPTTQTHLEELQELGMKRVVNLAVECEDVLGLATLLGERDTEAPGGGVGSKPGYWKIGLKDVVEEEGVGAMCREVCKILDSSRLHNLPTYVHCRAGKSRSVTAVLAYLIHAHHWTLNQSYAYVAERRKGISPNIGFVSELMQWEEEELRGHRHLHSAGDAPNGIMRSKTTAVTQKSAPADGTAGRSLADDSEDESPELPLGITAPAAPAPKMSFGVDQDGPGLSPVNKKLPGRNANRPHVRDSLPPHLSQSAAAGLSALDLDSTARSTMDPAQEMEVKDSTGRYRHAKRAPVNENTLHIMRRVSKAGLESTRWEDES